MKSFIVSLWHSRRFSLFILIASILIFSYLFFSQQSLPNDIPHTDKYGHILVFFCLSILLYKCFEIRRIYQIILLIGYGITVECIQHFISYRSGGIDDVVADAIGVSLFYVSTLIPRFRKLLIRDNS